MVGWLYSMRSATLRVVTACHPSSAAISRAAERMLCRISCRSLSQRCLIPIGAGNPFVDWSSYRLSERIVRDRRFVKGERLENSHKFHMVNQCTRCRLKAGKNPYPTYKKGAIEDIFQAGTYPQR